jgi:hypothetical protein
VQWDIRRVILVENETNLYLLPAMPFTLAVFSSGKALHLLGEIGLFGALALYYWGDLDEEGFIMLNYDHTLITPRYTLCDCRLLSAAVKAKYRW